jgi:hypothetical protein
VAVIVGRSQGSDTHVRWIRDVHPNALAVIAVSTTQARPEHRLARPGRAVAGT